MRQPIFTLLLFSFLAISSSAPAVNQTQPSKEDWLAIFESANHSPIDRAKAAFELASLASKNKQTPTALDYAKGGLTLIGDDQIETTARLRYLLATIYLGEVNFTKAESELLWLSTNHHLLPTEINLGSIEERLGYLYVNTNQLDEALYRLQKAVKLLEADGLQLEHGKATKSLGDVYLYKSNYYQAIDHYEDALALLTPFTTEKDLKAGIFNNIGVAYNYLGKYPEAIENYSEALKLDRELDNYLGVGYSINNIAAINHTLGNRDLALKAYQEALDLGLKHDLTPILTLAYRNIANIQMDDGNLNEALDTFSKALFYAKKANNKREIAGIRANIGSIYSLKKQFNEALSELKKGLLIELEINNPTGTASAKIGIAGVYLEQGKIQSALKYATEALALTTELKMLKFEIQAREIIAALEKKRRNPDKAISQFEKILKLRDSLYSNQAKEALAQFQARFDSEKQRKRIELLEREQEIEALKSAELKKDNELKNQKLKETEMYRIITLAFLGLAIAIILLLLGSINKSRYIKQSKIKMRRILDNIDQGILTLNKNLKMESEHSRYIESLVDQSNNAKEDFFHQLLNSSNLNAEKKHIIEEVLSICMNEDEMQWMVNKEALPTSLTILSSEGEIERLLSLYWQPLYDQHAKVEGVLLSLHDVTERKKL